MKKIVLPLAFCGMLLAYTRYASGRPRYIKDIMWLVVVIVALIALSTIEFDKFLPDPNRLEPNKEKREQ